MKLTLVALTTALAAAPALMAAPIVYSVVMNGPNESPANASPGTGTGLVTFDLSANTLEINMSFTGLTTGTTASHIHCCTATAGTGTAGVATQTPSFVGFPLGVMSGSYHNIFDLTLASSYNPAFVTANGNSVAQAEAALAAGAAAGQDYLNIHTSQFPNGEIRGFLQAVPEPGSFALAGLALAGVLLRRKLR